VSNFILVNFVLCWD